MKPAARFPDAHHRLKRLYDERAKGESLKDFGEKYDIGTKGMVWQYLAGHRPLNYEAAAKFAKGLGCTIYDICPEMAQALQNEILPFLGKALRRAAVIAAFAVLPALTPQQSEAKDISAHPAEQLCIMLNRMLRRIISAIAHISVPFRRLGQANL